VMNEHRKPEDLGAKYTKYKPAAAEADAPEPIMFALRDTDCDVDLTYSAEIARGTELAKAEFAGIWAEHGDRIIQEGKDTLYIMHVYGIAPDPFAHFLDGADAFVSREVEGRENFADRFAPLYGRALVVDGRDEQRCFEVVLRAILNDSEFHEALLRRAEEVDEEETEEPEDDAAPKKKVH
jgi:hypothetical protein